MQELAVVKSPKNAIVMNGFVGKNDNTEINGMGMETNKIQEGLERWNVGEQCGAANENDHGTQGMPQATEHWNVAEQRDAENVPGEMHGACDSLTN